MANIVVARQWKLTQQHNSKNWIDESTGKGWNTDIACMVVKEKLLRQKREREINVVTHIIKNPCLYYLKI